jgi:uncharacterized protein (DUF2267 family)
MSRYKENMKDKKVIGAILALVLILAFAGLKYHANQKAEKEIDGSIERLSAYADIGYENLSVQLLRPKIHIYDMTFMPVIFREKIRIDEVVLYERENNGPEEISVEMNGIHLDFSQPYFHNIRALIQRLGYHDVRADLGCSFAYNRNVHELCVKRLALSAENAGEIRVKLHLINLDLPSRQFNMATILYFMTTLPGVSITEAEIRYKDDSFVERLYRVGAENKRQSPESFTSEVIERINQEIQKGQHSSIQNALKSIRDFLKNPDEITLRIKPEKPVSFRRLQRVAGPKELFDVLNVKTGDNASESG